MSIMGVLVDSHHKMELDHSTQLVTSSWLECNIAAILIVAFAVFVVFVL